MGGIIDNIWVARVKAFANWINIITALSHSQSYNFNLWLGHLRDQCSIIGLDWDIINH